MYHTSQCIDTHTVQAIQDVYKRQVKDTDKGKELVTQIQDLKKLLVAYRTGLIKEKI